MSPSTARSLAAVAALVFALVLTACGGGGQPESEEPLLDPRFEPEVLFEERSLALPSSTGGNRFLAGWRAMREGGRPILVASETGARLQFVQLSQRSRKLVLDVSERSAASGVKVLVRAGSRDLGIHEISENLEIDLPMDLPLGRVSVDLIPQGPSALSVYGASMRSAQPKGDVRIGGDQIEQRGSSSIELVRKLRGGDTLKGLFRAPMPTRPGQEFQVRIRQGDRVETVFRWTPRVWDRFRGAREFTIPIAEEGGLVRIRLTASGEGSPGSWENLRIVRSRASGEQPEFSNSQDVDRTKRDQPPDLVVVYVLDALRADRVGYFTGELDTTPAIDRLASEGMSFLSHRSVAPNTLPSTKALITGRAPIRNGTAALPLHDLKTLAEIYREAGYTTGLFSNNPYVSETYGVDRGFDFVAEQSSSGSAGFHDDVSRIHDSVQGWLRSLEAGAKAFLYVHTLHPHNPYSPPPPFDSRFTEGIDSSIDGSTRTLIDIQRGRLEASEEDRKRLMALYQGNLAYNDEAISDLLSELISLYGREQIFLAITSDHGEELFEHGGVLHGYTLYEEMIRIPLVLWAPGRIETASSSKRTSTLDLHASLLDLLGATGQRSEGRSLLRQRHGSTFEAADAIHLAAAASVKGGIFSAQTGAWKWVWAPRTPGRWGMGEALGRSHDGEYLFDLENDPGERVNLVGRGGVEESWLRSRVLAWAKTSEAPLQEEVEIDEATRDRLDALGYLE